MRKWRKPSKWVLLLLGSLLGAAVLAPRENLPATGSEEPLQLAIIWHQHQPLYQNRMTGFYELPWTRVHAVQEYFDSPKILQEFPEIRVAYNLQPSLIAQLEDYALITREEAARGGVYAYMGASDPHLELALKEQLTPQERAIIQTQFFWMSNYIFSTDGRVNPYKDLPSVQRYRELRALAARRPLDEAELTDLKALFLLWQTSPELHAPYGLEPLRRKASFTQDDVAALVRAQGAIMQDVIAQYRAVAERGQAEILGSPYYHPILPLLLSPGWEGVKKDPWPDSVRAQLKLGIAQYEQLFGHKPAGLWPPEQAVSPSIIPFVAEAGLKWLITDQDLLARALGHTPNFEELYSPYVTEEAGRRIITLFRDKELSDRIGFVYGSWPTEQAVEDFLKLLQRRYEALADRSERLVVVALDGENWMFMSGYPDNGRAFLRTLYRKLSESASFRTLTPTQFLAEHPDAAWPRLGELPTGSWSGDLSTWQGEPEEDAAWNQLKEARRAVLFAEAAQGSTPALEEAWEAIRAAEGSDWFFWYGTDWDSGNDEMFDRLFKLHLITAYRAIGTPEPEIPQALFVVNLPPVAAVLGEVQPTLDGQATAGEWEAAAFSAGPSGGPITGLALGVSGETLYLRVDTSEPARNWIGQDLVLGLYASGTPEMPVNAATRFGGAQLGFGLAQVAQVRFAILEGSGRGHVSRFVADGKGGWRFASDIRTLLKRLVVADEIVEMQIPYSELGLSPQRQVALRLSLERERGEQVQALPGRPLSVRIPRRISGALYAVFSDPAGDDHGPGTYTYPTDPAFSPQGIFDLLQYDIYESELSWTLVFEFAALPNPWNSPLGFSHPILNVYLDVQPGGLTVTHPEGEAMHVRFAEEHPWDAFLKIAGWPAYGRLLATSDGRTAPIDVSSDPAKRLVIVTVQKALVPRLCGWHYVMVASQDGFAQNHIRPVRQQAAQWVGGGNPHPDVAPLAYDYLAPPGYTQEEILSGYDLQQGTFAQLVPTQVPCR